MTEQDTADITEVKDTKRSRSMSFATVAVASAAIIVPGAFAAACHVKSQSLIRNWLWSR